MDRNYLFRFLLKSSKKRAEKEYNSSPLLFKEPFKNNLTIFTISFLMITK